MITELQNWWREINNQPPKNPKIKQEFYIVSMLAGVTFLLSKAMKVTANSGNKALLVGSTMFSPILKLIKLGVVIWVALQAIREVSKVYKHWKLHSENNSITSKFENSNLFQWAKNFVNNLMGAEEKKLDTNLVSIAYTGLVISTAVGFNGLYLDIKGLSNLAVLGATFTVGVFVLAFCKYNVKQLQKLSNEVVNFNSSVQSNNFMNANPPSNVNSTDYNLDMDSQSSNVMRNFPGR